MILFRPGANLEVELDTWPRNPKSWEVFQGQRQGQPQPKVQRGHFSKVTGHFWMLEGGIRSGWRNIFCKNMCFSLSRGTFWRRQFPNVAPSWARRHFVAEAAIANPTTWVLRKARTLLGSVMCYNTMICAGWRQNKWAKRVTTNKNTFWGVCVFLMQGAKSSFSCS